MPICHFFVFLADGDELRPVALREQDTRMLGLLVTSGRI